MAMHANTEPRTAPILDETCTLPVKLLFGPTLGSAVRPRVVINAAMSVDGKIALSDGRAIRLSSEEDVRRVHQLRSHVDAIVVGVGTILKDDPKLTVNPDYALGRNPLRVVLDSNGRTPERAHVLDGSAPTLIVTSDGCERVFPPPAEVLRCGKDEVDIPRLLDHLAGRGIRAALVEGGSTVIWSFLQGGLVDELKVFIASLVLGGQGTPTLAGGRGVASSELAVRLRLDRTERMGNGILLEYKVVH